MVRERLITFLRTGRSRQLLLLLRRVLSSPSLKVTVNAVIIYVCTVVYVGLIRYPTVTSSSTLNDIGFIQSVLANKVNAWVWNIHPVAGVVFLLVYPMLYFTGVIAFGIMFYYYENRTLPF